MSDHDYRKVEEFNKASKRCPKFPRLEARHELECGFAVVREVA